jgi:hypothetical protein
MEQRQSIKRDGTTSKTPRYVATATAGYFKPLEGIKNAQNEIVMFYQRNDKCNPNSTSESRLQCKGDVNFSSVYFEGLKIGETLIGYGDPPQGEMLKPKVDKKSGKKTVRLNPFYGNRADGYLFIITPDMKTIEILIVPNGRYLIQGAAKQLADGQLNEALKLIREAAKAI